MILKNGKRIDGCTDTLPVGTVQPFLGLTPPLGYLVCQGQLISKVEYPELYKICGSTFGTETSTHFYLPDLRGKTIAGYDSNDSTMNTIGKLLGQKIHTHTSAAHTHSVAGHTHTSAAHSHSSAAHSHSTGNHTLTIAEIPAHQHMVQTFPYQGSDGSYYCISPTPGYQVDPGTHWRGGFADYTGGSGAHNHGNTGSTTPGNTGSTTPGATGSTSLTTNSTTPNATGSNTNFQPTVTMNWIVKAVMLIPEYFIVENTLTSISTSNALSAAQGKILDSKITSVEAKINQIGQNNSSATFSNFSSTINYKTLQGYNTIIVKNGWCTVRCYLNVVSPATEQTPLLDVPAPLIAEKNGHPHWEFHNWEAVPSGIPLIAIITDDGKLNLRRGEAGVNYFINLTYPIAE
jgi:microcystin-dependent protein